MSWRELAVQAALTFLGRCVCERQTDGALVIAREIIQPTWGAQAAQNFIAVTSSHQYCCDAVQACWRIAGFAPPWNLGSVGRMMAFGRYSEKAIAGPHYAVAGTEGGMRAQSVRVWHELSGQTREVQLRGIAGGLAPLPGDCILHVEDRDGDGAVTDEWHGHGMLCVAVSPDTVTVIEGNSRASIGPMSGAYLDGAYLAGGRGYPWERREGVGMRVFRRGDPLLSVVVRPSDLDFEPWAKSYHNSLADAQKAAGG